MNSKRWAYRYCLVLATTLSLTLGSLARAEIQVGDLAPDFRLAGSDGVTYQLSDFRGERAVVGVGLGILLGKVLPLCR